MNLNLNEFLRVVANALDTIEINIFGMPTNHSKRIAYISVKIARELRLTNEEIFDLASLAMMHDNGANMKILHDKLLGTTKEKIKLIYIRNQASLHFDPKVVELFFHIYHDLTSSGSVAINP